MWMTWLKVIFIVSTAIIVTHSTTATIFLSTLFTTTSYTSSATISSSTAATSTSISSSVYPAPLQLSTRPQRFKRPHGMKQGDGNTFGARFPSYRIPRFATCYSYLSMAWSLINIVNSMAKGIVSSTPATTTFKSTIYFTTCYINTFTDAIDNLSARTLMTVDPAWTSRACHRMMHVERKSH